MADNLFSVNSILNQSFCVDPTSQHYHGNLEKWKQNSYPICIQKLNNSKITKKQKIHIAKIIFNYYYVWGPVQNSINQIKEAINYCHKYKNYIDIAINQPCNNFICAGSLLSFQEGNYKLAYAWLSQGDATYDSSGQSQYNLGYMYLYGLGTTKNFDRAIHWYQQAILINPNIPAAFGNLGLAYEKKQDYQNAFSYYLHGAKLGDTFSQIRLAALYQQGKGVLQNNIQAYAWAATAVANGFKKGEYGGAYQLNQNNAVRLRDNIAYSLSLADKLGKKLSKAKQLAQQYYHLYVLHQHYIPPLKSIQKSNPSITERIRKAWRDLT